MFQQKYTSVEGAAGLLSLEQPSALKTRVGFNMQSFLLSATLCEPLTSCPSSSAQDDLGDDTLPRLPGVLCA